MVFCNNMTNSTWLQDTFHTVQDSQGFGDTMNHVSAGNQMVGLIFNVLQIKSISHRNLVFLAPIRPDANVTFCSKRSTPWMRVAFGKVLTSRSTYPPVPVPTAKIFKSLVLNFSSRDFLCLRST